MMHPAIPLEDVPAVGFIQSMPVDVPHAPVGEMNVDGGRPALSPPVEAMNSQ
jgi:hypothetical protein